MMWRGLSVGSLSAAGVGVARKKIVEIVEELRKLHQFEVGIDTEHARLRRQSEFKRSLVQANHEQR